MVIHSKPVSSEASPLTHSVAVRIVESLLAQLESDKQFSMSELIQDVEKHIADLPLSAVSFEHLERDD